jgi:23S rRNA pseudouridine1911/1915/1917 synthase
MAGKSAIKAPQDLQVLYEDNHLIAVNKPAGMLVQGDASGDTSLMDLTREYIRNKYRKPGNVFLGLLHRLDRPVSGVVLFAKTSKAASRISEQLRSRAVQKMYWALVHGRVKPPSGRLTSYLLKGVTKVSLVGEEEASAQKALLTYRTLRSMKGKSLLEIQLHTGRKHQIRAQLAGLGYPVEGDVKYGAPYGLQDKSIRLMARSLTVKHPTRDKRITIEAPPPEWM